MVISGQSVNLTTLFLGKLKTDNTALFESAERETKVSTQHTTENKCTALFCIYTQHVAAKCTYTCIVSSKIRTHLCSV